LAETMKTLEKLSAHCDLTGTSLIRVHPTRLHCTADGSDTQNEIFAQPSLLQAERDVEPFSSFVSSHLARLAVACPPAPAGLASL
jgi:hypothetical protein